jgi:hypothetical protein
MKFERGTPDLSRRGLFLLDQTPAGRSQAVPDEAGAIDRMSAPISRPRDAVIATVVTFQRSQGIGP